MISKDSLRKLLYFDVETASGFKNLDELKEKNPRLAKLWDRRSDYYKKSEYEENVTSDAIYQEKSALEPEFSRVVCVSFGTIEESGEPRFISFYGSDEIDILNKSNKVFNNAIVKGWKLCGHNIKAFDVPCLGKRMLYNGISPSSNLMVGDKKPWEIPFADTSELFSFGSWSMQKSLSLDLLACSLGVDSPKDDISGKEVTKAYWNGEAERIKEYCEKDVNTVIEILKKTSY